MTGAPHGETLREGVASGQKGPSRPLALTWSHGPRSDERIREVAMRSDRVLTTIDFHTAGIGMRLLTSGLGRIPGATIVEKRRWFQEHLDHVRTGLCLEPRGHRS